MLLLQSPDGVPIDIALAALPFEQGTVERSSLFEFAPHALLRTCSAEDLLVLNDCRLKPGRLELATESRLKCAAVWVGQAVSPAVVSISHMTGETACPTSDASQLGRNAKKMATNLEPLAEVKGQPEIMATFERLRGAR